MQYVVTISEVCLRQLCEVKNNTLYWCKIYKEKFEDTKELIRIRKSKKNSQHNDQIKNYKRTNNDLQNTHIKLKIE